jgi:hypothetical protein
MSENYPWFDKDSQITPGTLDPNQLRPSRPSQRWWNDYWENNPPGGLISFPPGTPPATPWTGFIDTNSLGGIIAASGGISDGDSTLTGGNKSVKTVTPDIEINNLVDRGLIKKDLEAGELEQLFLTDIGGRELISLSRHDQINGINQEYSPIKNLSDISLQYSPLEISPNADNVTTYLTSFNFDITKYVPTQEELDSEYPLEADASKRAVVYFDKETNSLNVHVKNIFVNEKIEVEFIVPEEVKDGTIY